VAFDEAPFFFPDPRVKADIISTARSGVALAAISRADYYGPVTRSSCMSAQSSSRSQPLSTTLVGTWELLSRVDRTATGKRRIEPRLGEDPVAILYYDRSGHFAAQFMKRDRTASELAAPEPATAGGEQGAPNNSRAQGGYDAYFGTYSVDDSQGTVTQRLAGALSAENVGLVLTRTMIVDGDTLTIALDTAAADGEPVTRTLVWRRASVGQ
jgi:hypothetical protein